MLQDIPRFEERLARCISDFDKCETGAQYVAFHEVTEEEFEKIELLRDRSYKRIGRS